MIEKQLDVIGIGNAIVDVIAQSTDEFLQAEGLAKGSMQLIDASRAEELYGRMAPARELSGGSVANTIAGLAHLGHSCSFVGQVANDQLGRVFSHDIRASGVKYTVEPATDGKPTAHSLILVTPDGQRTMNTFLGASQTLPTEAINEDAIKASRILLLEGYLWDSDEARPAMNAALEFALAHDCQVALTLSDAFVVERHRDEFEALFQAGKISIIFANRLEAISMAQTGTFEEALRKLARLVPVLVGTDGESGATCLRQGEVEKVPADKDITVVDTTGAGDLFAAGFLSGFLRGATTRECLRIGTLCASEAISHFGPRPETDLKRITAHGGSDIRVA